jgi:hypothetical protein
MTIKNVRRINDQEHIVLAIWATDCAERVLPYFEKKYPKDNRPRKAIEAGRAWAHGEITVGVARTASIAAHAAARTTDDAAACAAARSAGQAVATAHMVGHAAHAAEYAIKAIRYAASSNDADKAVKRERNWQYRHLSAHLRLVVFPSQFSK